MWKGHSARRNSCIANATGISGVVVYEVYIGGVSPAQKTVESEGLYGSLHKNEPDYDSLLVGGGVPPKYTDDNF